MKLTNIKRIRTEDFDKDDYALINKLAFALNPLLEQITSAFNKGIDFDNLNQEVVSITVEVNASGVPKTLLQLNSHLKGKTQGLTCINASNLENDGTFPTGTPFITFTQSGSLITIQHITGIPADKRYNLTVISIG